MTIGSHVAEIARQGIWASLTGGWCYEPANSIFCNTVHLYTWSVLLVTPLLIGIFASGQLALPVFLGYIAFIIILFTVLKLVVSYLHNVFDTTDPIIKYTTGKKNAAPGETCRSPRSSFSGRALSNNEIEMVDMGERRRRSCTDETDLDRATRVVEDALTPVGFHSLKSIHEDDSSSSSSGKRSHNGLLDGKSDRGNDFILPADSFELLPIASNRRPSEAVPSRNSGSFTSSMRKLSEPSFENYPVARTRGSRRRDSSNSGSMRRVHSTTDASHHHLPRRSSAYYLRESKRERERERHRRSSPPTVTQSKPEFETEKAQFIEMRREENVVDDGQEPCCSKSLQPSGAVQTEESKDIEAAIEASLKEPEAVLESSQLSTHMLRRIDRLNHYDEAVVLSQAEDLKGKITKFLEELIDKHPETLDVIESVRQNRLGRMPTTYGFESDQRHSGQMALRSLRPRVAAQSNFPSINNTFSANLRDGTHVAYDHEDTTEGAVHSFQDEHGTWWTYTFSDQGTGIAHPLGSTRAINELFNQRFDDGKRHHKARESRHRRHASAAGVMVPTDSSSVDLPGPSRSTRSVGPRGRRSESLSGDKSHPSVTYVDTRSKDAVAKAVLEPESPQQDSNREMDTDRPTKRRRRRRPRVHSSSSEDNEYISNVPTNVFHPVTAGGDNSSIHRQFVTIAHLASRLYSQPPNALPLVHSTGSGSSSHHPATQTPSGTHSALHSVSSSLPPSSRLRTTLETLADERWRRVLQTGDSPNDRREYFRLQMEGECIPAIDGAIPASSLSSVNTIRILAEMSPIGGHVTRPRQSRVKANYYYNLKPFVLRKGLQVKLDRLAVAALFDRNTSLLSCAVDVMLAALVTALTAVMIFRGIYHDFSLLVFAFVVAGSQFSLLKSVQPDAASPVHGFNWLVTYSRPVYFSILAVITLLLDFWASEWSLEPNSELRGRWNWNPYELHGASKVQVLLGVRDLVATLILLLPVAFTVGVLPQVTTLLMHVVEQVDMHLLGGTAAFSLFSSVIAFMRSSIAVVFLSLIGHIAFYFEPRSTQNTYFSAFLALVISVAFVMSRWSTNPLFLTMLFRQILPSTFIGCFRSSESIEELQSDESSKRNLGSSVSTKSLSAVAALAHRRSIDTDLDVSNQDFDGTSGSPATVAAPAGKPIPHNQVDPLPRLLLETLAVRVHSDLLFTLVNALAIFALHCTSVFSATQPYFELVVSLLCISLGFLNHYFYRKLRTHTPWKVFNKPILKAHEFNQFESTVEAKLMLFERIHIWMLILEKDVLYPLLIASYMTNYAWTLPVPNHWFAADKFAIFAVPLSTLCSFRITRSAYAQPQQVYIPLLGTFVLSHVGARIFRLPFLRVPQEVASGFFLSPLLVLYVFLALWPKIQELTLKLNFILAYIAPWQISWGSAFHAFAQPFSLPHSGLILVQAVFSSLISAPLNPFLGSSFFLMSYVRPVKFWEKDYNTKRVDHSNLRLISQLDRGPMMDDSNLNAIFYEHLTRSLQQSLAGDLMLGRWATTVQPGDCFILASLYLNCLVHIIEVGNGFVTFQVRGLEFRGTYCHQREVEAISEDLNDGGGFCCCTIGNAPGLLSINNMFALRWLAWEVTASKYIIDGYSITDNSAVNLLQVHELRRLLVSLYVKCIIYYTLASPNFEKWLMNEAVLKALEPIISNSRYVDTDQMFCTANDEDYDLNVMGISRQNFVELYGHWILHCYEKRIAAHPEVLAAAPDHQTITCFCFALSILGRRTLGAAAYNRHANAAESFLFGLHALFKGDLRVTSALDEWVCCDPDILSTVISPAVKMALKLHQDHFAAADDYEEIGQLYERIQHYQTMLFISHEHDPAWRQAIISNTQSLLALRHMYDDGQDDYKIIMLNKMHLNMRVIKLNRECVRAFWSGQQQELIFFRNRNPERGSIQNARQVLRNMINSSADQPIGYPIYVSPLTTSFVESHSQMKQITGPPLTFCMIANGIRRSFRRLKQHFGTSGSTNLPAVSQSTPINVIGPNLAQAGSTPAPYRKRATTGSVGAASAIGLAGSIGPDRIDDGISIKTAASSVIGHSVTESTKISNKSRRRLNETTEEFGGTVETEEVLSMELLVLDQTSPLTTTTGSEMFVRITDKGLVMSKLNEPMRSTNETLCKWPSDDWRKRGGRSGWPYPIEAGIMGSVAHIWKPFHPNRTFRSHAGHIYLVRVQPKDRSYGPPFYVPVQEGGFEEISRIDFLAALTATENPAPAASASVETDPDVPPTQS